MNIIIPKSFMILCDIIPYFIRDNCFNYECSYEYSHCFEPIGTWLVSVAMTTSIKSHSLVSQRRHSGNRNVTGLSCDDLANNTIILGLIVVSHEQISIGIIRNFLNLLSSVISHVLIQTSLYNKQNFLRLNFNIRCG